MIKQFVILAQFLGLFFYQLFFAGDLTVTQKVPSSIVQGEEAIIEITINKSDLPGFAKVQQVFPEGFTAEPIETKGATFSFKDNKLKFIWMSLPEENVFTISYKIVADETVEGDFSLGGKFSFISESERKNIEIPVSKFSVVKKIEVEEPIVVVEPNEILGETIETQESVVDEEVAEIIKEELPVVEDISPEVAVVEKPQVVEMADVESVSCKRTIEPLGNGKFNVVIEVSKKGIEGFSKITEKIPVGFKAVENNSNNGVFSFKNNTVKILWMGTPSGDVFTVSYDIEAMSETENGQYDIIGYYSYLKDDATTKFIIDGTSFKLDVVPLVAEDPVKVFSPKEEKKGEPETAEELVIAEVAEKQEIEEPVVSKKDITSTPSPEGKVSYKVQVGAGHKKVPSTYFATVFKLQDKVSTINHEGWIKYLVGSYGEYKLARDKRNVVRGKIRTSFVTAYNSGTRITVQEALMISNQKWYK